MLNSSQKSVSVRPYLAMLAMMFALWFAVSGWITSQYVDWQNEKMVMQAAIRVQEANRQFRVGLDEIVGFLSSVSGILSQDARVLRLLESGGREGKTDAANYLSRIVNKVYFIYSGHILDSHGREMVSVFPRETAGPALQGAAQVMLDPGEAGVQYYLNKTTGDIGIYLVVPVNRQGHLAGAVAIRLKWVELIGIMRQPMRFMMDKQGVAVASPLPGMVMSALPEAAVFTLPEAERLARYGRKDFPVIPLSLVREYNGFQLFSLRQNDELFFRHVFHVPGGQLRIVAMEPVPSFTGWQLFLVILVACGWLGILIITGVAYHFHQRRVAEYNRQQQQMLHQMATHDPLTGAYNRSAAEHLLEQTCMQAEKSGSGCALLFVDLDKFKEINDGYGHIAGDIVLQETSSRLQSCVRHSDSVVRYGGDEFLLILGTIHHASHIAAISASILEAFRQPIHVGGGNSLSISASIGIAVYPVDGRNFMELSAHADEALYRAKEGGRARFVFYSDKHTAEATAVYPEEDRQEDAGCAAAPEPEKGR
ncbi:MAG: GGDEF domain-containing protein [Oxalobacter formigenes]|nr:GGDEF domain-containing protein [Oxalobacter formigenes]